MSEWTLVTGAAGFVGGHLLGRVCARGEPVAGWHRPGQTPGARRADVQWHAVELLDRDAVSRAIEDLRPARVFHLAAAAHVGASWQNSVDTYRTNVLATAHLLDALVRFAPSARVLVPGSATLYKSRDTPLTEDAPLAPGSPYATSKLAQEMLAIRVWREQGLHVLVARSFNHTGPGQDPSYVASGLARQIARVEAGRQEPVLRLGNLEPKRDLSDVRDVVRAYELMLSCARPGVVYNVCSGRALAIRTLVETLIARAAVAVRIEQDPALFRPTDAPLLVGDHARLTADTGWTPEIPLERTLDDLLDFWRARTRDEQEHERSSS